MRYILLSIGLFLGKQLVFAQTQIVRGTVTDKASEQPLIGASVVVVNSNPIIGTTTDENGKYEIPNVPLGRQSFAVQYVGLQALQCV